MSVISDFSVGNQNAFFNRRHRLEQYSLHYKHGPINLVIEWPTAGEITFGETVSNSVITGGSALTPWGTPITGTFDWVDPDQVPGVGDHDVAMTFTPDELARFGVEENTVALTVGKAIPTIIEDPVANTITYGQILAESAVWGGDASVDGSFSWADSTIAPDAGYHEYTVIFTPDDHENYATVETIIGINVDKADPQVYTWPVASSIDYGQTLNNSTLTGGSTQVPGTFAWVSGSIVPNHSIERDVIFVPNDTDNYNTVDGQVFIIAKKYHDTGWFLRLNGQTSTINMPNSVVMSAQVRFRGVNTSTTSYTYNNKTVSGPSGSAASGNSSGSRNAPTVSSGWQLVWCQAAAGMQHASGSATGGSASARVNGSTVASTSNWWYGSNLTGDRSVSPGMSVSFQWSRASGYTYNYNSSIQLRERYATTTIRYTQNPAVGIGSVISGHVGTLGNGSTTSWRSLNGLQDNAANTLTHSASGSNRADYQIQVTYYTTS